VSSAASLSPAAAPKALLAPESAASPSVAVGHFARPALAPTAKRSSCPSAQTRSTAQSAAAKSRGDADPSGCAANGCTDRASRLGYTNVRQTWEHDSMDGRCDRSSVGAREYP
jgi:hypothetical protein